MKGKTSKKWNVIIPVILFVAVFLFWNIGYREHILYLEETDFFLFGKDYARTYLLQAGGWTAYAGNFLTQLYRWVVVGALLQTLYVVTIWWCVCKIGLRLHPGGWPVWSYMPVVLVFALQCNSEFVVGESLRIVIFFLLGWAYFSLGGRSRYWIFTLFLPLFAMLLAPVQLIFLYIAFVLYELGADRWRQTGQRVWGRRKIFVMLWILLLVVWPLMWQRFVYPVADADLYALSQIRLIDFARNILYVVYGWLPFLIVFSWLYIRKRCIPVALRIFAVVVVAGAGYYAIGNMYERENERMFQLYHASREGDWDRVIRMAAKEKNPAPDVLYFITLALNNKGELPEKLFAYPVLGDGCLSMPKLSDYTTLLYGAELYDGIGIYNEAIHKIFEAAVLTHWGIDFVTIKRLITLHLCQRNFVLADKYLSILERSLCYKSWTRAKREEMAMMAKNEITAGDTVSHDFFIGGRPFLSDMARVYDREPTNRKVMDYILCGLLLRKDLNKFCGIFNLHSWKGEKIPKAYAEALMVAGAMEIKSIKGKNYPISPEIRKAFQEYSSLYEKYKGNKVQAQQMLEKFKDTWWYYVHFRN